MTTPMQLKFDANQPFQLEAVEAVAALLDGQPRIQPESSFALGAGFAAVANWLDLGEETVLDNLQTVQRAGAIPPATALEGLEGDIETADGTTRVWFPNFSVEMETGTGKTYVYLRTALELFARYGLRKFIVVVPSVAVREGVLKTLQITEDHFRALYQNLPYRYYPYDSANLARVRQFALSDSVEIMVMTLDAFNKDVNVINQNTDRLQGETPIHLVQATHPILILDEPQNMESEKSIAALARLNPLLALRYSATHRNPYNLVYRLSPYEAYRQALVKRIEVASVVRGDDFNQVFIRLDEIKSQKNTVTARLAVHKLMKDGTIKEKVVAVKPGESLAAKADRPEYAPFEIEEINPGTGRIVFANGREIEVGESQGADKDAIFGAQIRYTVEEHFRKQRHVRDRGIKVLSLFFIDRVANYIDGGVIRRLFDEAFDDLKTKYPEWAERSPADVQGAYFAERRSREGTVELQDSVTGTSRRDEKAYDLIMRDKERLLSFDQPVAFIFSHSALREGWDNPNVFQICTLNQTASEMKKRQEVGRGMRLAVDQTGARVHDERVNVLTVTVNESYAAYVATLQSEIEAEYGAEGTPPKPANARERGKARLRAGYTLNPEFQELWERIKRKTRYAVTVDTEKLISDAVADLESVTIAPPRVTVTKWLIDVGAEDKLDSRRLTAEKGVAYLGEHRPVPNLLDLMAHLLAYTTPPISLSRGTLLEIYRRTSRKQAALANPQEFANVTVRFLKSRLADQLVDGIRYEKINAWYEMAQFDAELDSWENYLVPTTHSLYDHVVCDSEVERRFVEGLEQRDDVRFYVKLPAWFTVSTPVGEYNPDWAIVMEDRDAHGYTDGRPLLYLVRETKSTATMDKLRPDESRKIRCGEKHFEGALDVSYRVVTDAAELP